MELVVKLNIVSRRESSDVTGAIYETPILLWEGFEQVT